LEKSDTYVNYLKLL